MKFKHTFHVFVDNFNCTYKLLLYRIIVSAISLCLYTAVLFSFLPLIMDTSEITALNYAVANFLEAFTKLDFSALQQTWGDVTQAFEQIIETLTTRVGPITGGVTVLIAIYLIEHFFLGLGNYTLGSLINDKMAMRASSPFFGTLIKNLGKASLYNAIYVPLSFAYDALCIAAMGSLFFLAFEALHMLVQIFLFVTVFVFLTAIKMTLTTDWLPALVYGKKNNREAMRYSLARKGKPTLNVLSNYVVLVLIIFALNFAAIVFTLGAGFLITMPASYVLLIAFEFVNYCDNNNVKYFIDKNTIVKPDKEHTLTREEFFKGEN